MYNNSLSVRARLLYYLIDDKANDDGQIWWHWRKLALLLGVSRSQYFEVVGELKRAGIVTVKHDGNLVYYNLQRVRKTGLRIPENRNETGFILTEPVQEPVTPLTPRKRGESSGRCKLCRGRGHRTGCCAGTCPGCGGSGYVEVAA